MERRRGHVAVVTGAGSGIGAAIAYQLQDAGLTVVGLDLYDDRIPGAVEAARREAEKRGRAVAYRAPSPGKLHSVRCDVSKEEDVVGAFRWVRDNLGAAHVLVNNAGRVGDLGLTEDGKKEWKTILDLNVIGLSICTREAIQLMREKGIDDGHIVNICSVAGHTSPIFYDQSMYWASKHAVRVLTEGLRKELVAAKSKIRVSQISPGLVKTNIGENLTHMKLDDLYTNVYLNPEDIADAILYALSVPPHVQIHELYVSTIGGL